MMRAKAVHDRPQLPVIAWVRLQGTRQIAHGALATARDAAAPLPLGRKRSLDPTPAIGLPVGAEFIARKGLWQTCEL
jgi:hypothetical protein